MTCGWQTGKFRGRGTEPVTIPTPVFLIRHPGGDVLVDTGLHPIMGRDPASRIGDIAKYFSFSLADDEAVDARLAALDVEPTGLHALVLTHLHYDHAGGAALIPPSVDLYIQAGEWAAGHDEQQIAANFYIPDDYAQDRTVHTLDGEHDLFGDGQVRLIPTPGHSPGHQSVLLTPETGTPTAGRVRCCGGSRSAADRSARGPGHD